MSGDNGKKILFFKLSLLALSIVGSFAFGLAVGTNSIFYFLLAVGGPTLGGYMLYQAITQKDNPLWLRVIFGVIGSLVILGTLFLATSLLTLQTFQHLNLATGGFLDGMNTLFPVGITLITGLAWLTLLAATLNLSVRPVTGKDAQAQKGRSLFYLEKPAVFLGIATALLMVNIFVPTQGLLIAAFSLASLSFFFYPVASSYTSASTAKVAPEPVATTGDHQVTHSSQFQPAHTVSNTATRPSATGDPNVNASGDQHNKVQGL